MAKPLSAPFDKQKVVAENRRARFDYFVEERFEAGIQLAGGIRSPYPKGLIVGEVTLTSDGMPEPVAHVTSTYSIPAK